MAGKWGDPAKRAALRRQVFTSRWDEEGNLVYEGDRCYLCQKKINLSLPAGLPGSPEMEDVAPVSRGGDPLSLDNLRPAHKKCNERKGDLPVDVALRNELTRRQTSRVW